MNNKAKIIQKKLFRLTKTEDGFEYERIRSLWERNIIISEKDKLYLERIMDNNADMKTGEEMMVIKKIYDKEPMISIDKTYIILKKGEINPELN
jgi:hypothetical protein